MIFFGVAFIAALCGVVTGALCSPDRTISGKPAMVTIGIMVLSGLVLAVHAL